MNGNARPESLNQRGDKAKEGSKNFDKRKVQCHNCEKHGHFISECWLVNGKGKAEE